MIPRTRLSPLPLPAPTLAPSGRRRAARRARGAERAYHVPPGAVESRGPRPPMGPLAAAGACLARSFDFAGRARRDEYWGFVAVLAAVLALDLALEAVLPTGLPFGALALGLALLATPAAFAAGWRRLHDVDRPGWYSILHILVFLGFAAGTAAYAVATGETGAAAAQEPPDDLLLAAAAPVVAGLVTWGLVLRWLVRPTWPRNNRWGKTPNV